MAKTLIYTIDPADTGGLVDFPAVINIAANQRPGSVDDTFDGVDGATPDALRWDDLAWDSLSVTETATATIQGNQLSISIVSAQEYVYLRSKYTVHGDFEAKVDFNCLTSAALQYWSLALAVVDVDIAATLGGNWAYSGLYDTINGPYRQQTVNAAVAKGGNQDTSGTLRLVRSGSTLTIYYWDSGTSSWVSLVSDSSFGTTDVYVELFARTFANDISHEVKFNNFQLVSGTVVWPDTIPAGSGKTLFDASTVFTELPGVDDWKKIIFTDSAGNKLYAEKEVWDPEHKRAVFTVKVPVVSNLAKTEITVDYSAANADNSAFVGEPGSTPSQNVYNSNILLNYTCAQDPSGTAPQIIDSTANALHGTTVGTMTAADLVDGLVGYALDFDGVDDGITVSGVDLSQLSSGYTLECLIAPRSSGGQEAFICVDRDTGAPLLTGYGGTDKFNVGVWGDSAQANAAITNDVLQHAAIVFDGTTATLYVNGAADPVTNAVTLKTLATGTIYIGFVADLAAVDGLIANVQISKSAQSADWLAARHKSLTDTLFSVSDIAVVTVALSLTQPVADMASVLMGLNQPCGMALQLSLTQPVRDMRVVSMRLSQIVADLRKLRMQIQQPVADMSTAAMALKQPCALSGSVAITLRQPVALAGPQLTMALKQPCRLADTRGSVQLSINQPCVLIESSSIFQQIGVTVTVGGRNVHPDYVKIRADESAYVSATIRFPDYVQYAECAVGEHVVITDGDEITQLIVESLTNPEDPGSADHIIIAGSKTKALDVESLTEDLGPGICDQILSGLAGRYGIDLDYRSVQNWPFNAHELTAENETALAVMRRCADASGCVLQSDLDGNMIFRPDYPDSVNTWETASTILEINDQDHIFSIDEVADPRDGFNAFLVSGETVGGTNDRYRFVDGSQTATTREIDCYQVPWEDDPPPPLEHVSGDWVSIEYLGIITKTIENEEMAIISGIGKLQNPIYELIAAVYKDDELEPITIDHFDESGELTLSSDGDALTRIDYVTKFRRYKITNPRGEHVLVRIPEEP